MRLLTLYEKILESLHVYADDVGLLTRRQLDGQSDQILVDVEGRSRRLVLPRPELLRKGLPDELVAFHPLAEINNRGESEVFRKLKLLVNLRLTMTMLALMEDLTELAADKKRHSSLPPKLLPLLEAMPHADQKLVDNLGQLLSAALAGGKNRLLSIYLNRGGKYMGQARARLAVVSFPILEELDNPERKVYGVQLRAKDIPQIKALFEWLLPGSDTEGTYNAYSDSMDTPFFEALMQAYAKVASKLNHAQKIASKYLEDSGSLRIDLSWLSELDHLDSMRFEIPALDGNKGIPVKGTKADTSETVRPSPMQELQSRVSEPEPVSPRGMTSSVYHVDEDPYQPQLVEEPKSGIRTNLQTADEMRMSRDKIRPFTATAPEAAARTPNGPRTLSEVMGQPNQQYYNPQYQPHQPPPQASFGGFAETGWGSPAPAARPSPFAVMNAQQQQVARNNGGWAGGWSTNQGGWNGGRL